MFLGIVGPGDESSELFPDPGKIEIATAVQYLEKESGKSHWVIIEDAPNPSSERNEISPTDELAVELMGKECGESFYIRRDPIQSKTATIKSIKSKYMFRKMDVMLNGESRFGSQFPARKYTAKTLPDGSPDISLLLRAADIREAEANAIDAWYRQNPVSVTSFAVFSNEGILDSITHLAQSDDLPIRCCLGNNDEWTHAGAALESKSQLIIDPTALATLFLSNHVEDLRHLPTKPAICESSLEEYQEQLEKLKSPASGYIGKYRGRIQFVENNAEAATQQMTRIEDFLKSLRSIADIKSDLWLADLDPKKRKMLVNLFGEPTAESIAYAVKENVVLWSDDIAVATVSMAELGVKRVWSQRVLDHLCEKGLLSESAYVDSTLFQVHWKYKFTRILPPVILEAGRRTQWNPTQQPLAAVISSYSQNEIIAEGVLGLCAAMIQIVNKHAVLAHQQENTIRAMVHATLKRKDGRQLVRELANHMHEIIPIDVLAATRYRSIIEGILSGLVGE